MDRRKGKGGPQPMRDGRMSRREKVRKTHGNQLKSRSGTVQKAVKKSFKSTKLSTSVAQRRYEASEFTELKRLSTTQGFWSETRSRGTLNRSELSRRNTKSLSAKKKDVQNLQNRQASQTPHSSRESVKRVIKSNDVVSKSVKDSTPKTSKSERKTGSLSELKRLETSEGFCLSSASSPVSSSLESVQKDSNESCHQSLLSSSSAAGPELLKRLKTTKGFWSPGAQSTSSIDIQSSKDESPSSSLDRMKRRGTGKAVVTKYDNDSVPSVDKQLSRAVDIANTASKRCDGLGMKGKSVTPKTTRSEKVMQRSHLRYKKQPKDAEKDLDTLSRSRKSVLPLAVATKKQERLSSPKAFNESAIAERPQRFSRKSKELAAKEKVEQLTTSKQESTLQQEISDVPQKSLRKRSDNISVQDGSVESGKKLRASNQSKMEVASPLSISVRKPVKECITNDRIEPLDTSMHGSPLLQGVSELPQKSLRKKNDNIPIKHSSVECGKRLRNQADFKEKVEQLSSPANDNHVLQLVSDVPQKSLRKKSDNILVKDVSVESGKKQRTISNQTEVEAPPHANVKKSVEKLPTHVTANRLGFKGRQKSLKSLRLSDKAVLNRKRLRSNNQSGSNHSPPCAKRSRSSNKRGHISLDIESGMKSTSESDVKQVLSTLLPVLESRNKNKNKPEFSMQSDKRQTSPKRDITPHVSKDVQKESVITPLVSTRVTNKPDLGLSDLIKSSELKRLQTTDGFWSPPPKPSIMFESSPHKLRDKRRLKSPPKSPIRQKSILFQHCTKKLKSLKKAAAKTQMSLLKKDTEASDVLTMTQNEVIALKKKFVLKHKGSGSISSKFGMVQDAANKSLAESSPKVADQKNQMGTEGKTEKNTVSRKSLRKKLKRDPMSMEEDKKVMVNHATSQVDTGENIFDIMNKEPKFDLSLSPDKVTENFGTHFGDKHVKRMDVEVDGSEKEKEVLLKSSSLPSELFNEDNKPTIVIEEQFKETDDVQYVQSNKNKIPDSANVDSVKWNADEKDNVSCIDCDNIVSSVGIDSSQTSLGDIPCVENAVLQLEETSNFESPNVVKSPSANIGTEMVQGIKSDHSLLVKTDVELDKLTTDDSIRDERIEVITKDALADEMIDHPSFSISISTEKSSTAGEEIQLETEQTDILGSTYDTNVISSHDINKEKSELLSEAVDSIVTSFKLEKATDESSNLRSDAAVLSNLISDPVKEDDQCTSLGVASQQIDQENTSASGCFGITAKHEKEKASIDDIRSHVNSTCELTNVRDINSDDMNEGDNAMASQVNFIVSEAPESHICELEGADGTHADHKLDTNVLEIVSAAKIGISMSKVSSQLSVGESEDTRTEKNVSPWNGLKGSPSRSPKIIFRKRRKRKASRWKKGIVTKYDQSKHKKKTLLRCQDNLGLAIRSSVTGGQTISDLKHSSATPHIEAQSEKQLNPSLGGKNKRNVQMLKRLATAAKFGSDPILDEHKLLTRTKRGVIPNKETVSAQIPNVSDANTTTSGIMRRGRGMRGIVGRGRGMRGIVGRGRGMRGIVGRGRGMRGRGRGARGRGRGLRRLHSETIMDNAASSLSVTIPENTSQGASSLPLPILQPLDFTAPANTSLDGPPPVLTPQSPLSFDVPVMSSADTFNDFGDDVVEEFVDESNLHLYWSDEEKRVVKKGSPMKDNLSELQSQPTISAMSHTQPKKLKGKKGRPPGIKVTRKSPKTARKSVPSTQNLYQPKITELVRTFEFRKKTTRSPLEMLEMKRRQEEALYDLEEQQRRARLTLLRERRNARISPEAVGGEVLHSSDEEEEDYDIRPCFVVLNDFVKKLQLDGMFVPGFDDSDVNSSPFSWDYEDDAKDEDWYADLEDIDEDEEDIGGDLKKRPHIPRLKLKRVIKNPNICDLKSRNLVSQLKSPDQEPLKLVIKTELPDEDPNKQMTQSEKVTQPAQIPKIASKVPASSAEISEKDLCETDRSGFVGSYLDFLKERPPDGIVTKPRKMPIVPKVVTMLSKPPSLTPIIAKPLDTPTANETDLTINVTTVNSITNEEKGKPNIAPDQSQNKPTIILEKDTITTESFEHASIANARSAEITNVSVETPGFVDQDLTNLNIVGKFISKNNGSQVQNVSKIVPSVKDPLTKESADSEVQNETSFTVTSQNPLQSTVLCPGSELSAGSKSVSVLPSIESEATSASGESYANSEMPFLQNQTDCDSNKNIEIQKVQVAINSTSQCSPKLSSEDVNVGNTIESVTIDSIITNSNTDVTTVSDANSENIPHVSPVEEVRKGKGTGGIKIGESDNNICNFTKDIGMDVEIEDSKTTENISFVDTTVDLGIGNSENVEKINIDVTTEDVGKDNTTYDFSSTKINDKTSQDTITEDFDFDNNNPASVKSVENTSVGIDEPSHDTNTENVGIGNDKPSQDTGNKNVSLSGDEPSQDTTTENVSIGNDKPVQDTSTENVSIDNDKSAQYTSTGKVNIDNDRSAQDTGKENVSLSSDGPSKPAHDTSTEDTRIGNDEPVQVIMAEDISIGNVECTEDTSTEYISTCNDDKPAQEDISTENLRTVNATQDIYSSSADKDISNTENVLSSGNAVENNDVAGDSNKVCSEKIDTVHNDIIGKDVNNSKTEDLSSDCTNEDKAIDVSCDADDINSANATKDMGASLRPDNNTDKNNVSQTNDHSSENQSSNSAFIPHSNNNNDDKPSSPSINPQRSPIHSTSNNSIIGKDQSSKLKVILPQDRLPSSLCYTCKRCGFTSHTKLTIESHIYTHIPGAQFQCATCQIEFSSMAAAASHLKNTHLPSNQKLNITGYVDETNFYDKAENTTKGDQDKTSISSVSSQIASSAESQSSPFIISVLVSGNAGNRAVNAGSGNQRRYVCSHCGFSTNVRDDIEQHVSDLHSSQGLYACSLCDASVFTSEDDINQHCSSVHPTRPKPYRKLPDFYDAAHLAKMVQQKSSQEECGSPSSTSVYRVSSVLDVSDIDSTSPVDHKMKAKEYLYMQEDWKGKKSVEADSTTGADYSEETPGGISKRDDMITNDIDEDRVTTHRSTEKETNERKSMSQCEEMMEEDSSVSSLPEKENCGEDEMEVGDGTLNVKITEVVSLSEQQLPAMEGIQEGSGAKVLSALEGDAAKGSPELATATGGNGSVTKVNIPSASSIPTSDTIQQQQDQLHVTFSDIDTTSVLPASSSLSTVVSSCPSNAKNSLAECSSSSSVSSLSLEVRAMESTCTTPSTSIVSSAKQPHENTSAASLPQTSTEYTTPQPTVQENIEAGQKTTPILSESEDSSTSTTPALSSSSAASAGLPLTYKCKGCKVHTPYLLMMVKHLKSRHSNIRCFSCPYCKSSSSFISQKQLRHHIRSQHPSMVNKNEISLSKEANKLVEPMVLPSSCKCTLVGNRLVLEEDIHTCTLCSIRMTSMPSVYDHLKEKHSDLFEFICPVCQAYKSKSLQAISNHCISQHDSNLDKDKFHVSVPKYLFQVLKCISANGKYIEKAIATSDVATSSKPSTSMTTKSTTSVSPSLPSAVSCVTSNSTSSEVSHSGGSQRQPIDSSKNPPQTSAHQLEKNVSTHILGASSLSTLQQQPQQQQTTPLALAVATPTGTIISPLVTVPVNATGMAVAGGTPTQIISSSLFDTSSLVPVTITPNPSTSSDLGSANKIAAHSSTSTTSSRATSRPPNSKSPKNSGVLPVLNVPSINKRNTSVSVYQQYLQQQNTVASSISASQSQQSSVNTTSSTICQRQPSVDTDIEQLPEDEPNPDAFKIFNLRPSVSPAAMAPNLQPSPASAASPSALQAAMSTGAPSVFPPVSSSSLGLGFLPGPIAGFPAAMVIPPNLVHNAFPFAAAANTRQMNPSVVSGNSSASASTQNSGIAMNKMNTRVYRPITSKPNTNQQYKSNQRHSIPTQVTDLLQKNYKRSQQQVEQVSQQQQAIAHQNIQPAHQQQQQQLLRNMSPSIAANFMAPYVLSRGVGQQAPPPNVVPVEHLQRPYNPLDPTTWPNQMRPSFPQQPQELSSQSQMSSGSGSLSTAVSQSHGQPTKKGKRGSQTYRCPYCPTLVELRALDVASHIQQNHPGKPVAFLKIPG